MLMRPLIVQDSELRSIMKQLSSVVHTPNAPGLASALDFADSSPSESTPQHHADLLCYQEAVLGPASSPPIAQACHML